MTVDAEANLRRYLDNRRDPSARYASFDYCFNYFRSHYEAGRVEALAEPESMQTSCLQLGFYLASWGMFRGSTTLLTRSAYCFGPVIDAIIAAPALAWEADVSDYDSDTIAELISIGRELGAVLPGGHSDTLVTKTMLGVFGCVPAFDSYFRRGIGTSGFRPAGMRKVHDYWARNVDLVEQHRVRTLDFGTGAHTERRYTQAKVIDMIFFVEGSR
jgi:hypothetical protein